jgi:hypothetical protein
MNNEIKKGDWVITPDSRGRLESIINTGRWSWKQTRYVIFEIEKLNLCDQC